MATTPRARVAPSLPADTQRFSNEQFVALAKMVVNKAHDSFPAWLSYMYPPNHSNYKLGKLHMYLAHLVQGTIDGTQSPRQAVSVPPQHGKSRLLSVRAVAWVLGHEEGINIALTGFSHSLLTGFVSEVRAIMDTAKYQAVFPNVRAVRGSDRQDEAVFTNGSSLIVKSAGTKLTGRRVDWLIVDDAHAGRAEAESKSRRKGVEQWFFADCVSRLSPTAKVFIIGTRWHPEDLIGALTSKEYVENLEQSGHTEGIFNVVNFPAIADHNSSAGETCPLGREEGEALFPEERPLKFLQALQAGGIPAYEWDSQYMGKPRAQGSGQTDIDRITKIDISEVPENIPWVRGWDLALTEAQTSDFSAGALCAYDSNTQYFYIIDMWKKKYTWARMKPQLISVSLLDKARYNCQRVGLEAVGAFDIGLSELRTALSGEVRIEKRNPARGGKLMRAMAWLNAIEARRVFIVRGAWNKDFLDELHGFPEVAHDDQIDATSVSWECLVRAKKLRYD